MNKTIKIVIIKNYWERWLQSCAWFFILAVSMSFAVWLKSTAMQWIMAIVWLLAMICWAVEETARKRITPEQAIAELQELLPEESPREGDKQRKA